MLKEVKKDIPTDNTEEKTILSNIVSLAQQLLQSESAEGTKEEGEMQTETVLEGKENVKMAEGETETEEEKKKREDEEAKVKKSTIETTSEGATANDDAEEKVDDPLTNITDETIDEVAKAIVSMLYKNKNVKKSVNTENSNPTNKILGEIVKIQKSMLARQEETENAIANLIKGFGIADEVTKAYEIETNKQVKKGLNDSKDVENTINYIAKALRLNENQESKYDSNIEQVRKSLNKKDILAALTYYRK